MTISSKREPILLLVGDILLFFLALWVALLLRYVAIPTQEILALHLPPFSILFAVSVAVFYIAGLYEKHTLLFKSNLPSVILNAQIANAIIAVLFFYLIPYFGIAPKTNLFFYLVVSSAFIFWWRVYGVGLLGFRRREKAILIGTGEEMRELKEEVNNNSRYSMHFISSVDLDAMDAIDFEDEVIGEIYREGITSVVIDLRNEKVEPVLPKLYNLIFSNVKFIDKYKVYEDIFDRVPVSLLTYNWFLENISFSTRGVYDFLKRAMDILLALMLGTVSLIVYPFVWIAVRLDDGGPLFFIAERVGRNNQPIRLVKFRSMSPQSKGGGLEEKPHVTKVGKILRKTRIDELPQLWNVLKGDISLVGPRPEYPSLVKVYEKEIPYYNVRHLITPGLSGWAQIHHHEHPHHEADVDETKRKLSYDLYYVKNRSFMLDLKIALRTVRTLISRSGV